MIAQAERTATEFLESVFTVFYHSGQPQQFAKKGEERNNTNSSDSSTTLPQAPKCPFIAFRPVYFVEL